MGDAEVVRETSAPIVGGGVFVRWDCNRCDTRDGAQSELFRIASVGGGSSGDASGSVFEAEMCGSGTCGNCGDGAGFLSDYK